MLLVVDTVNGWPFSFAGPALIHVRRDRPYAFTADLRAGATHLVGAGSITQWAYALPAELKAL